MSGPMWQPNDYRIPVEITPGFWARLCLLLFLDPRATAAILTAAALHELGHLLALRLLGIPVFGLRLSGVGASLCADLRGDLREAWAILAGPGVNLLLALCLRSRLPGFALCNLALAAYNLLPVQPLDGGRLCAGILPRVFGAAGDALCRALAFLTAVLAVCLGVIGTCVLRLGLLPCLSAAAFLLRLGACQTERKML